MDRPTLYDDDIVTWADEQVAALRALAARSDLSNAVDWENVIEEIESVGRSDIERVESALAQMLIHILKYASAPSAQSTRSWRTEVLLHHAAAEKTYRRSMRQRIDWDRLWARSIRLARAALDEFGDSLIAGLPDRLPFTPEELTAPDFDMDRGLERLAAVLKSPPDRH
ncbi:DUF29 domain-containing protein [Methylobacterium sp. J-076]|uniref:DUF29 domain-containing protein n=1 Tax=Methylobacterium sp. J-076 TaxID=2836655 RepID=UPI001FB941F6|nr:DUF29 domain-containing protein [Methylobacterium sp. J-076]MCJ2011461.1 DUF29 domain-containing protein [Methylobacterium sp. J-076]